MIRKVLVMNRFENGKQQTCGLLTLEQKENLTGRLRVYDLDTHANLKLSLKIGDNRLLFDNILSPENFLFSTIYHNLNSPIYATLFSDDNGQIHVIASGHSEGEQMQPDDMFDDYKNDKTLNEIKQMIDAEIDKQNGIANGQDGGKVDDEKKDVNASAVKEKSQENIEQISIENDTENPKNEIFFELIKPQIDELFSTFPHNKELEQKIENSSWINVSNGGESYVLGQIFDDEDVAFICYGIPAENMQIEPPKHLKKFCQWLPLSAYKPEEKGFWVMYQNAKTGENVVIDQI